MIPPLYRAWCRYEKKARTVGYVSAHFVFEDAVRRQHGDVPIEWRENGDCIVAGVIPYFVKESKRERKARGVVQ